MTDGKSDERTPPLDFTAHLPSIMDVVGTMWSHGHTADRLGLTPDELRAEVQEGRLLGLTPYDSDRLSFPIFQFYKRDGHVRLKPDLAAFFPALIARDGGPRDPWSIAIIARTPAPELDDLTPEQWATQGRDTETLVLYASRLSAEFAR